MSPGEAAAQIIEDIYGTIDADGGWMSTLKVVVDGCGAQLGNLSLSHKQWGSFVDDCMVGGSEEVQEKYRTALSEDPRFVASMEQPLEIIKSVKDLPGEGFESSPSYHELFEELGVGHSLMMTMPLTDHYTACLGLMRSESKGPYRREEVEMLKIILPHVKRVLTLQRRLRQLEEEANHLVAALDGLPSAALIVSEELAVICGNRRSEEVLREGTCLQVRRGRVTARLAEGSRALQVAVKEALKQGEGPSEKGIPQPEVVCLSRPGQAALEVLAIPLRQGNRLSQKQGVKARVLLMIYDPEVRRTIVPELLERLFDLTFTEAVIAARLAEGFSIQEIAAERRCSVSTVRTHVKRIMQKTHTNRQGELVQLILTSPAVSLAK